MLYKVQKRDIKQAREVLADAFQHDPVWNKLFEGEPNIKKRLHAFFETPVRYCMKYGEVYAPSEDLEGIIAWIPGKNADMKTWLMICSGAIGPAMRIGLKIGKKMGTIFKPVIEDRHKKYGRVQLSLRASCWCGYRAAGKGIRKEADRRGD